MRTRSTVVTLAALLLSGCNRGPSVDSVVFAPDPSSTSVPAVRLYRNTLPRCAFEEVGLVRAQGGNLTQLADAIRTRASAMGGDAIVGLAQAEHTTPGQAQITTSIPDSGSVTSVAAFSVSQTTMLSGTVVRFVEPSCRS